MQKYTKIYLKALGYDSTDFIPSEISGVRATDLHHIECKGMGGDPSGSKDRIENLIALTRQEHDYFGDKKQFMAFLYKMHMDFLQKRGVQFDSEYLTRKISQYETTKAFS